MRVRVNSLYFYNPVLLDVVDGRTNLKKGDIVRVVNLNGAPPANTMGHCYVADPNTNEFIGMVACNSLEPISNIKLRQDLPTVFAIEYRDARKALIGGTRPVVAHGVGWPDNEWKRVCEVKSSQGAFFARFLNTSDKWTKIDGLEVR